MRAFYEALQHATDADTERKAIAGLEVAEAMLQVLMRQAKGRGELGIAVDLRGAFDYAVWCVASRFRDDFFEMPFFPWVRHVPCVMERSSLTYRWRAAMERDESYLPICRPLRL
jgi:hypothetical protein